MRKLDDEIFMEELLTCTIIMTYNIANIWHAFDINENIVTRQFLTQNICKRNYST